MFNLLLAVGTPVWNSYLWYAVPAIIAISLVYSATRHEAMRPILIHAVRVAVWITGFMFTVFVVLQLVDWWGNR